MKQEEYYRQLAMHLRSRRLPESRITSILTDVAEGVRESGNDPTHEFGTPEEYAKSFPARSSRSLEWWLVRILALHTGIALAVFFALSRRQDLASPVLFGLPAWLYPGAAFVALVVVGGTMGTRLPRGFRASSDGIS